MANTDKGPALGEASASPADDSSVHRVYAYATLPLPRALILLVALLAGLGLILLLLAGFLAAALLLSGLAILLVRVLVLLVHSANSCC
jgi:hypothetical protein